MIQNLSKITIIFLASILCIGSSFATNIPIPQLTPGKAPTIITLTEAKQKNPLSHIKHKLINTPSADYAMIKKGKSIDVYEDSKNQIFIQKIYLGSGAKITSIFDFHTFDSTSGEPLYSRFSVEKKINNLENPPFSFINGQFFDPRKKYTPFSFGFKLRDTILTAGADNRNERKNIFSYSSSGVRIIPYTWENLRDEQADFALVNLSMNEPHEKKWYMGRTYLCILSPDRLGYSQTLLTFSFIAATENFASDILHSWGCRDEFTSKLDSSGSSVFGLEKIVYHGYSHKGAPDYRKIPQIIGFYED